MCLIDLLQHAYKLLLTNLKEYGHVCVSNTKRVTISNNKIICKEAAALALSCPTHGCLTFSPIWPRLAAVSSMSSMPRALSGFTSLMRATAGADKGNST